MEKEINTLNCFDLWSMPEMPTAPEQEPQEKKQRKSRKKNSEVTIEPQVFICPVCGQEFQPNEKLKYYIGKDKTCSWDCFINYVKEHPRKGKDK